MHHEITMKWNKYVTGTVKGTIFEGAHWVKQFALCETPLEAAKLFNTIFKDQWSMSTFEIPRIKELQATSWRERYAMMKLFSQGANLQILLFMTKKLQEGLGPNRFRAGIIRAYDEWIEFRPQFTMHGNIAVLSKWPSDGPNNDYDCVFRVYSPEGKPLTCWDNGDNPVDTSGYYDLIKDF